MSPQRYCRGVDSVTVRVPAKVNLSLRVGDVRTDGYHELTTVFHAISLTDEVTVTSAAPGAGLSLVVTGDGADSVPTDDTNLAAKAATALARWAGMADIDISIRIAKSIPVAGGMAGGSADAAATLVACRRLWDLSIDDAGLQRIAAGLGSDVTFGLVGGTARGTGRGESVTPVLASGELHWVVALAEGELSTARVYDQWDRLVEDGHRPQGGSDDALLAALRAGDPRGIGPLLVNDLQAAALALRPSLGAVLEAGEQLGALGSLVSGSGPTCVFLAGDRESAVALAAELAGTGLARSVRYAVGPVPGARIVAAE